MLKARHPKRHSMQNGFRVQNQIAKAVKLAAMLVMKTPITIRSNSGLLVVSFNTATCRISASCRLF